VPRTLVTGGAGFIGSHVAEALLGEGHEVVVLDLRTGPGRGGGHVPEGVTALQADVRDLDAVRAAVRGVDAVSHQAAKVGLGVDFGDVLGYVTANDVGTATLLAALHETGFAGRLVVASSMVVYGEGRYRCPGHGVVRPGPRTAEDLDAGRFDPPCTVCGAPLAPELVDEEAPVDPRNVYATTKLQTEHLALLYGREHAVPTIALRYHNVYGPRLPRDTPYAGVASTFVSALRAGRAPTVLEDGRQRRDFVHVRDVARANVLALTAGAGWSGPLNIASGQPRTVGQLPDALADAVGPDAPRPVVAGGGRLGDVRHVVASPARAREVLGFTAAVPFEEGVRELVDAPLLDAPPDGVG
jgi:dTDP-L-rhamnose 4-epimerase